MATKTGSLRLMIPPPPHTHTHTHTPTPSSLSMGTITTFASSFFFFFFFLFSFFFFFFLFFFFVQSKLFFLEFLRVIMLVAVPHFITLDAGPRLRQLATGWIAEDSPVRNRPHKPGPFPPLRWGRLHDVDLKGERTDEAL